MSHYRGRITSHFFLGAIAVAFLLGTGTPATAASRQAQERAARKACLSGDFAKGVDILSELFVETKNTTWIFNQGRCFQQNRRYEDAIARFHEYLRAAQGKLNSTDKAAAEQNIADCKEMLAQEQASSAPAAALQPIAPAAQSPAPLLVPVPAPEPAPPALVQAQPQASSSSDGSALRIGGVIVASAGIAGVVAGVLFNLKANAIINDMESARDGYSSTKNADHSTYETAAWASYGVGAACVVTGAILYGVGLKAKSGSSLNVAILPAVGLGQPGAAIVGVF